MPKNNKALLSVQNLTITINNITGVLYLVKRGDGYVATKTVG